MVVMVLECLYQHWGSRGEGWEKKSSVCLSYKTQCSVDDFHGGAYTSQVSQHQFGYAGFGGTGHCREKNNCITRKKW